VSPGSPEPQDQLQQPLRPRPKLADHPFAANLDEVTEHESDDDGVVELTGDRNEVGHEVDREREITNEREQQQLSAARYARVACQSSDEDDAVGDKSRERASVATAACEDEREHDAAYTTTNTAIPTRNQPHDGMEHKATRPVQWPGVIPSPHASLRGRGSRYSRPLRPFGEQTCRLCPRLVAPQATAWNAAPMLLCEECGCESETGRGWLGYIAHDPEDGEDPAVCTYCPPCAERHLDANPRINEYR